LTDDEVLKIIGSKSFLNTYNTFFNDKLKYIYGCKGDICTFELLAQQTMDSSVTQLVGLNSIIELEKALNKSTYPYDKSFELKVFFIDQYGNSTHFEDLAPSLDTMNSLLFKDQQNTTLLELNNAIDLYNYYIVRDLYGVYKRFQVTSLPSLDLLSKYIFDYLPNIFLYRSIGEYEGKNLTVLPNSLAFNSLLTASYKQSNNKLVERIREITLAFFFDNIITVRDNLCMVTMKAITVEPLVSHVCNNENLDMKTYKSLKNWILPYYCLHSDCKTKEKNYLIDESNLLYDQILEVYDTNTAFGELLSLMVQLFNRNYKCTIADCSPENLAKRQMEESYVTLNLPEAIRLLITYTIKDWDKEEFKSFEEYSSILKRSNCTNCTKNIEEYINNNNTLVEAFTFERNGIFKGKPFDDLNITDPISQFHILRMYVLSNAFDGDVRNNYKLHDLLDGKTEDDLSILRSGTTYENFKPNINQTTGFNMNQSQNKTDTFTMTTGRNSDTRSITKLNGLNIFNTYELVYNNLGNEDDYKQIPLYNGTAIPQLSDGIQFSTDKYIINYYDSFTSRSLQFKYSGKVTKKYNCLMYYLSIDLAQGLNEAYTDNKGIATAFNKFNKPYVISPYRDTQKRPITDNKDILEENEQNHICIDEFSEYVVSLKLKLVVKYYS
jgi:hypothetical protein